MSLSRALRRRRDQRGATVFIVVLVLAMLTGIGLFAAQAGSIATATSGATRANAQSRYFAESAMLATIAKVSLTPQAHVAFLENNLSKECLGQQGTTLDSRCLRFGRASLEKELNVKLFEPHDAAQKIHGTLGRAAAESELVIELTGPHPYERVPPGFDVNPDSTAGVRFRSLMLHGRGSVHLAPPSGDKITLSATAFRAELIVGPLPKN